MRRLRNLQTRNLKYLNSKYQKCRRNKGKPRNNQDPNGLQIKKEPMYQLVALEKYRKLNNNCRQG